MEPWQQIAYGAALVERMYPNFALFAELIDSDAGAVYRNILNLVWEFVSGKNQRIDFQKQLDKLEQITPDTDQHDFYGVWPALDASVGLSSLLSACVRTEPQEIVSIELLSQSTIENYLTAVGADGNDNQQDALMAVEQAYRVEVEKIISRSGTHRPTLVTDLKLLVLEVAGSNIGLELS